MNLARADLYQSILHDIERGQYEVASQKLSQLRSEIDYNSANFDVELVRKLLTLRLSIRNGYEAEGCLNLDPNKTKDLSLKGEIYLVQGLYYVSKKHFSKALLSFRKAEEIYKLCDWAERHLICSFNRIACEINLHGGSITETDFENLIALQKEAELNHSQRLLGLIHRQKSYYFKDQLKWRAAAFEAETSLKYLELHASRSDYQIALFNLCDCYIELEEREKALTTMERVVGPLDRRIIFINEFIEFRLGRRAKPPEESDHADPHFLCRWKDIKHQYNEALVQELQTQVKTSLVKEGNECLYYWDSLKSQLVSAQNIWPLRPHGKEAVLIETLINEAQSAQLIAERLWPEFTDLSTLMLRLYQLVSRMNKKFPGLIQSKNGKYSISCRQGSRI